MLSVKINSFTKIVAPFTNNPNIVICYYQVREEIRMFLCFCSQAKGFRRGKMLVTCAIMVSCVVPAVVSAVHISVVAVSVSATIFIAVIAYAIV